MTDDTSGRSFGEPMTNPDNVQDSEVETTTETQETVNTETTPEVTETTTETQTEETTAEPQLTEKGTKLDPNPQSAVHQQLANTTRTLKQYEQVLSNPQLLAQYMKAQFPQAQEATETPAEVKEYKAEDLGSLDDVAKVVNSLQKELLEAKTAKTEVAELKNTISTLVNKQNEERIINNLTREIESVQKLPVFDKNSPDYIPGLDDRIMKKFHELDFDEQKGFYKGQYSLAKLTQDTLDDIALGKKTGSLNAQTVVKDKTQGQIKTSPKVNVSQSTDEMKPEDSIAQGIAQMFKH